MRISAQTKSKQQLKINEMFNITASTFTGECSAQSSWTESLLTCRDAETCVGTPLVCSFMLLTSLAAAATSQFDHRHPLLWPTPLFLPSLTGLGPPLQNSASLNGHALRPSRHLHLRGPVLAAEAPPPCLPYFHS